MNLKPPSKAALRKAGYALTQIGLAERTRPLLWDKAKAYALKAFAEDPKLIGSAPIRVTTEKPIWVTEEVPLAIKWYLDKGGGYKGVDEPTLLSRIVSMLPKAGILGSSDKNEKSLKVGVLSRVVYLSPAWESGMVMCPHFGVCGKTCIGHLGRMGMPTQTRNRLVKTVLWKLYPDYFLMKLGAEATNLQALAMGKGLTAAIRLNGSSDVRWERYGLMERFPSISWYDYTKIPIKNRGKNGVLPANYHLTFSMDENPESWECAYGYLEKSQNVAIVIGASWSTSFHEAKKATDAVVKRGYIGDFPVISGDDHDARFKDISGHFIALRAKGLAAHDAEGFVYRADKSGNIINVPRRSLALANRYFPGAAKGHRGHRAARSKQIPILHADHGLTKAHKELVQQELTGWDGSFTIREVDLPASLSSLPSALYGPQAGDAPVKESEVVYETRGDRKGPSRLINAPMRPSRSMVIIAGPGGEGPVVYTAYGGQVAPREPWDASMNAREKSESKKFWAQHALSR